MVERENVADAKARARQHIGQRRKAVEKAAADDASAVHVIGEEHRKNRTGDGDDERVFNASQHRRRADAPELVPVLQREGVDTFRALQKAREEHAAVLQHDHYEENDAQRDHAPAHCAAVRQREPEPALRSAAALGQPVRAAHQRAVDEKEHNGRDEQEHVHCRGLFKVRVSNDLQIDVRGQRAEAPADDDGRAEVRERADEREQQAHERRGPNERQDNIAQDGAARCAEVARRAKAALVQLFEDAGEKHCVERHERDRLHQDDAPAIVGVQAQVQQAVGDPPAPPVELDIGKRRDERRRHHGDERDDHAERLLPPARRGAYERR